MVDLISLVLSLAQPKDMAGPVAVHAAYVIHTTDITEEQKCCGECGGTGRIVQGDGHSNPCPCPADCECKAVTHPPVIIKPSCKGGKCAPPKP